MGRSDQFIGLTRRAMDWLDRHGAKEVDAETSYYYLPCFDYCEDERGLPLRVFELPNGVRLYESVQEEIWDSGPMYFTYIVDKEDYPIPGLSWNENDFYNALGYRLPQHDTLIYLGDDENV